MNKLFQLLLCLLILSWTFSTSLAQQASVSKGKVQTHFLNPDQECTGEGELIYDDGSFENGYGWNADLVNTGIICMLFTPEEYPWHFTTACISFTQNVSSSLLFDLVVYDNTGAGGAPGTLVAEVDGLSADGIPPWPALSWYEYDISSLPTLDDGSWYIGVRWNDVPGYAGTFIGADESPSTILQLGYCWDDYDGAWFTNETLWPGYRAMGIRTLGYGQPCGITAPTNPNPADYATDVSIDLGNISWTNSAGTTGTTVWFGEAGNMVQVYDGAAITSWSVGTLDYNTNYQWKVRDYVDSCGASGSVWHFKTMMSPGTLLSDPFDDISDWTIVGLGLTNWLISGSTNAGGVAPPELEFSWSPSFVGASYFMCNPITVPTGHNCELTFTNYVNFYTTPCGPIGVAVTTDGGTTFTSVYESTPTSSYGPEVETVDFVGTDGMQIAFYYNGDSYNINYWYIDDALLVDLDYIPVALASFRADVNNGNVELNWSTATETNNKGFEIERNSGNGYEVIAFVNGSGTSTQTHNYTYIDNKVQQGNYFYRLRQVDFDGSSNYSNSIEISVEAPKVYLLEQNYPNPFNPSTQINFSLAVDSKVSLKVFNILGQEVMTLLSGDMTAGSHFVTFNASNLTSGVYIYKLEANGVNGSNFSSVKKMVLTK